MQSQPEPEPEPEPYSQQQPQPKEQPPQPPLHLTPSPFPNPTQPLLSFITTADLPFEDQLLLHPSVKIWLRYTDSLAASRSEACCAAFIRGLSHFPSSYKLWRAFLTFRLDLLHALDDIERLPLGSMQDFLSLSGAFERCLLFLPHMPAIWLLYLRLLMQSPAPFSRTFTRRTFDRALRTLPPSLHGKIWAVYRPWAERVGGQTFLHVWRRYLRVDQSKSEEFVRAALDMFGNDASTAAGEEKRLAHVTEAARMLLLLARLAERGEFSSGQGKSPFQLLCDWLDVVVKNPEIGSADDGAVDYAALLAVAGSKKEAAEQGQDEALRMEKLEDSDIDPACNLPFDVARIVLRDGICKYRDQASKLWTGLANYWISKSDFPRAAATFERALASVVTLRDFTHIFDSYAEFLEGLVEASLEEEQEQEQGQGQGQQGSSEVDAHMKNFEDLMDRRPFLLNDTLIRRNVDDVTEWRKRVALFGDDQQAVIDTYLKAIETINPKKATAGLNSLYIEFATFYESHGDLDSARKILEKATHVNFRKVDELAEVWCEWSEMELRNDNYDEAIRVMQRAAYIPKNVKVSYHDESLPPKLRLFKSLKLWAFYVDLEESIGSVESTQKVYDQIMDLRIANAHTIVNYANFLQENKYFEESYKVYERGIELFGYPIAFELWNIYLGKFIKRYGGSKLERARDLFEQALETCPPKFAKPLFLMYGKLEEEHGLAKRAMNVYDRATRAVSDEDKFDMFTIYIAKATVNFGLPAIRPLYERAIEALPDRQTAEMCLRFAGLERKLGEIDRARAIYAHASQFCDPRVDPNFWVEWNAFEIEHGSEDTFREMLRIKRAVQSQYNTEVSFLSAQASQARAGKGALPSVAAIQTPASEDPMAGLDRNSRKNKKGLSGDSAFIAASESLVDEHIQAEQPMTHEEIEIEMDLATGGEMHI